MKPNSEITSQQESQPEGLEKDLDLTSRVLDQVVESNIEDLKEVQKQLSGTNKAKVVEPVPNIDPELMAEIVESGEEIASKLESDSAKAKTAFAGISALLNDDQNTAKQPAIDQIRDATHDSALQMFANIAKEIVALRESGKINADEEKQAIEKLVQQFSFLNDGKERKAEESVELAMLAAEKMLDGETEFGNKIADAAERGVLATVVSIKKNNPVQPSQVVKNSELEEEKPKKRGISYKKAEEIAKAAAQPTLRLGIALAIAFAVPGVGVVLAAGFMFATSPKEPEEKKSGKRPEDNLPVEDEVNQYRENQERIRQQIAKGGADTEIKKATHRVELAEQEDLEAIHNTLNTTDSSLKRVDVTTTTQEGPKSTKPRLDAETLAAVSGLNVSNLSHVQESESQINSGAITSADKESAVRQK